MTYFSLSQQLPVAESPLLVDINWRGYRGTSFNILSQFVSAGDHIYKSKSFRLEMPS